MLDLCLIYKKLRPKVQLEQTLSRVPACIVQYHPALPYPPSQSRDAAIFRQGWVSQVSALLWTTVRVLGRG